jgi:hypothetical protein
MAIIQQTFSRPVYLGDQAEKVLQLRSLLAEKFPAIEARAGGVLPTGLADLDAVEGGVRRGAVTELCSGSGAGALFIHGMLRAVGRERCFAALVDAGRSFEPDGAAAAGALARLLVVFCADAMQGVKATDLLLRDGNVSLIMLDLQGAPARQLQGIPSNTWHRLQRLAEQTTAALVVLTPRPMVEAARVRITAGHGWTLGAQRRRQRDLAAEARWRVFARFARPGAGRETPAWEGGRAAATA